MAIVIGDNISLNLSKPNLDMRWGPYDSVQEAFDALDNREVLCVGLTVGVRDGVTGKIDEYWFRNKAESVEDLVKKNEDDNILQVLETMKRTLNQIDGKIDNQTERLEKQEQAQESDEWLVL